MPASAEWLILSFMQIQALRHAANLKKAGILALVALGALGLSGCVELTANKSKVTVKPGNSTSVKIKIYNPTQEELGDTATASDYDNAKLCAVPSKKKLIKVTPKCQKVDVLLMGETLKGKFKIKVTKKAAAKKTKTYKVTFVGTSTTLGSGSIQTTVKVKVPKAK